MSEIVNCIIVDDEPVAREILEEHLSKIQGLNVLALCKNAVEAFNKINTDKVDLIFLDINMPEISGLSFAKSINKDIKIIFTTAYGEYAVDGFDLQAVDYLLKPISFERLLQAINKYLVGNVQKSTIQFSDEIKEEKTDYFFVRADRKMVKVRYLEINYIESISDYIKIHLSNKNVVTRETISNIEAKLPQSNFLRTHRSYIISMDKIVSFTNEEIELSNQKVIPVSRSYKNEVLKRLENDK